jgi:hypothetical protein
MHLGIVRPEIEYDLEGLELAQWHARALEPHRHIAAEIARAMHVDRVAHRLRPGEERAGREQAAPISATTRSVAAASQRPRPAAPIIGMYEKSLASAAIDRLRSLRARPEIG